MTHPIDPVPIPLESSCTMRPEPRRRTSGRLARLTMTIVAGCAALLAAGGALAGQERFRYHYVSLDAAVPPGFAFFDPVKIVDDGRVYGTAWTCGSEGCRSSVAVYRNGAMTVLHEGAASDANNAGTVGGDVVLDSDPNHFVTQAALFRAGRVELIPPRPNELQGQVLRITDSGIALVQSTDSTSLVSSYYLYRPGREISLGFGGSQVGRPHVNDLGVTAGTTLTSPARAFRFQPPANMTLLAPVSPDPESWGLAIASNGDVLGYSFDYAGEERIGVWRKAVFQTWFIEATAEYPTISNSLLWNRSGLIVISDTSDLNSYLVPRPGVRLNVADLTDSLPTWTRMFSINARGDMVGWGGSQRFQRESTFLLQRLPEGPGEVATWKPHAFSPPAAYPGLLASHGGLPARIEASLFGDTAMRKRK